MATDHIADIVPDKIHIYELQKCFGICYIITNSLFYAGDEGIHPAKDGPSKAHAYKQEKRAKGRQKRGREREIGRTRARDISHQLAERPNKLWQERIDR